MADWSIWKALEEWRGRRHELDSIFAQAGVCPELESIVNRISVDLRRQPPTPPLLSGDKMRDEEALKLYHEAYHHHYDDSLYQAESMLQITWVAEAAPLATLVRREIARIRQTLKEHPGRNPGVEQLEQLLRHYVKLDHPEVKVAMEGINQRRQQLVEIAGYPLLVQQSITESLHGKVPPLASQEFMQEFANKAAQYRETEWLHNRVITTAYVTLALDSVLARAREDSFSDVRLAQMLPRRWPAPSVFIPGYEQIDQMWYILLTLVILGCLYLYLWIPAGLVGLWVFMSMHAHRRERMKIEEKRNELAMRLRTMKQVRDRFVGGQTALEKLSFPLHQLDEQDEYYSEDIYALLALHQNQI